eukprot:1474328-Amphidinium_carterae.1
MQGSVENPLLCQHVRESCSWASRWGLCEPLPWRDVWDVVLGVQKLTHTHTLKCNIFNSSCFRGVVEVHLLDHGEYGDQQPQERATFEEPELPPLAQQSNPEEAVLLAKLPRAW